MWKGEVLPIEGPVSSRFVKKGRSRSRSSSLGISAKELLWEGVLQNRLAEGA